MQFCRMMHGLQPLPMAVILVVGCGRATPLWALSSIVFICSGASHAEEGVRPSAGSWKLGVTTISSKSSAHDENRAKPSPGRRSSCAVATRSLRHAFWRGDCDLGHKTSSCPSSKSFHILGAGVRGARVGQASTWIARANKRVLKYWSFPNERAKMDRGEIMERDGILKTVSGGPQDYLRSPWPFVGGGRSSTCFRRRML